MRRRLSPTDRFFLVMLLLVAGIGLLAYGATDRTLWEPVMELLGFAVAGAILVNLIRLWQATVALRRRRQ